MQNTTKCSGSLDNTRTTTQPTRNSRFPRSFIHHPLPASAQTPTHSLTQSITTQHDGREHLQLDSPRGGCPSQAKAVSCAPLSFSSFSSFLFLLLFFFSSTLGLVVFLFFEHSASHPRSLANLFWLVACVCVGSFRF